MHRNALILPREAGGDSKKRALRLNSTGGQWGCLRLAGGGGGGFCDDGREMESGQEDGIDWRGRRDHERVLQVEEGQGRESRFSSLEIKHVGVAYKRWGREANRR